MKALTLWRPWPWAIFHAPDSMRKTIENRPWKPWASIIGKRIALHAGKHFDSDGAEMICSIAGLHPDGRPPPHWDDEGIIGTAVILRYFTSDFDIIPAQQQWWSGPFAWALGEIQTLPNPILCRGSQGLWDLPAEVEAQVEAARRAVGKGEPR